MINNDIIINKIQKILDENFTGEKAKINVYYDRLNFACPYCGDSTDNNYKKRGNLFLKNYTYHCYNDGCPKKHTDLLSFLKDFNNNINNIDDLLKITDIIEQSKRNHSTIVNNFFEFNTFSVLKEYAIDLQIIKNTFNLVEIKDNIQIETYLKNRLINQYDKYLYDPIKKQLYIFNLCAPKKVVSYQIRNFDKYKSKYISYNIENIHRVVFNKTIDVEYDLLNKINVLSLYFNIFSINFRQSIYVFEGPIDAMFLKNSIAVCGVDKNTLDFANSFYFFDNDSAGKNKMISLIKEKKNVFLWSKLIKNLNIDIYIKDFNDLLLYLNKNKLNKINLKSYFSNNPLDIFYI